MSKITICNLYSPGVSALIS